MSTHYDVLGVARSATAAEIEDQYRALAKIVHPDVGGDAVTFDVLKESYDVLSDPARRAGYDRSLAITAPPAVEPVVAAPVMDFSLLRPSTPEERRRGAELAERGIQSWHQTPGQHFRAGLRGRLKALPWAVLVVLVLLVLRAIGG